MASILKTSARKPIATGKTLVGAMPSDDAFTIAFHRDDADGKNVTIIVKDYELMEWIEMAIKYANDPQDHGAYDTNLFKGASINHRPVPATLALRGTKPNG